MSWFYVWVQDSALTTATPVDWVDIGVLSWLFYQIFLFLRGTRAMQSLIGIAVLGLVYLLSDLVGLTSLNWVLDNFFGWVVLALIILFQEDIRRALARAGGTIFSRTTKASDAQVLEELVKACFGLAKRRVGALVAIERTGTLAPYADGAHRLDAVPSTEIIQAIFHPTSPVHDGAVLLCGRRLHSAGVFLPISLSKDVSRAYGTRHRAAIGITEETDAICLVVSEERGTVSLVQDGVVEPMADANELRQRLREGLERGVQVVEKEGDSD